jgi:hypothetical protein
LYQDPMHLVIPFASSRSEGCLAAAASLKLPHLQKLLSRMLALPSDTGDEFSLSPPHERAMAHARGLPVADGLIPWASLQAQTELSPRIEGAWAFISLCHWRVGNQQAVLTDMPLPDFSAQESHTLMAAMASYFAEDGITLHEDQPGRWLAQGAIFQDLPTAALDRVVARNVKPWLPPSTHLLRLQNEMQMLLYTHPVNDAREALGLPTANSFWIHGTGTLPNNFQSGANSQSAVDIKALRYAALAENWPAWVKSWQAIDDCECQALLKAQARGEPLQLTLCGERQAQTWVNQTAPWSQRFTRLFKPQRLFDVLEVL